MSASSSSCGSPPREGRRRRPFVGVLFRCCRVYQRLYLAADRRAYEGGCPRCGRRLRLVVAPDGAEGRFFEAGG